MSDSTLIFTAGSGDCYGDSTGSFDAAASTINLVGGVTDSKTWIPFVVTLQPGIVVVSATYKHTGSGTSGLTSNNVVFGCEAADNPSTPTTKADLYGRTMTTATNTYSIGQYVLNTLYSYDVTNAVTEVLARSGWAKGNTLAILTSFSGSPHTKNFYSATGTTPETLEIVVRSFIPRSGDE